jgi:SAM-dependent methyltransferase
MDGAAKIAICLHSPLANRQSTIAITIFDRGDLMTASLDRLKSEFDRWAREGRGEGMEEGHVAVTRLIVDQMPLRPDSRVLDLGCGTGWATRMLAARVPDGIVTGLDVSDEMIRRAREHPANPPNVDFRVLAGPRYPFHDQVFSHCLSVESLYYHPDLAVTFGELHRVLAPDSHAWLMVNFFRENPYVHHWAQLLDVPVHLLSGDEYCQLASQAGFASCRHFTIPDPTPVPPDYTGRHYGDAEKMRAARAIGSLVIVCEKES